MVISVNGTLLCIDSLENVTPEDKDSNTNYNNNINNSINYDDEIDADAKLDVSVDMANNSSIVTVESMAMDGSLKSVDYKVRVVYEGSGFTSLHHRESPRRGI